MYAIQIIWKKIIYPYIIQIKLLIKKYIIITEIVFNTTTHYYINKDNFVFDEDAYLDYIASIRNDRD